MAKKHFLIVLILFPVFSQGQPPLKQFLKLSLPEKVWVASHPFIAAKAYRISREAELRSGTVARDYPMRDFPSGGQTDAFRHCYWMALLAQEIKPAKARSLGAAHEKGNYRQYKKNRMEFGARPTKAMCEMDLWNNEEGLKIGMGNKGVEKKKIELLAMEALMQGRLLVLKMDEDGNFLTCEGFLLDKSELNKWNAPQCLVPSNQP